MGMGQIDKGRDKLAAESKLVLDKFHLNKAILESTARQPEKDVICTGP